MTGLDDMTLQEGLEISETIMEINDLRESLLAFQSTLLWANSVQPPGADHAAGSPCDAAPILPHSAFSLLSPRSIRVGGSACFPVAFPLQNVKEQAPERRSLPHYHDSTGTQAQIFKRA